MTKDELFEKLLQRCDKLLSRRPRSIAEIRRYLVKQKKRRAVDDALIERVIKHLKDEGLLDDGAFVAWWIEQRRTFKPKSEFVLRGELLQKGVYGELVDEYFSTHRVDEGALALQVLRNKRRFLGSLDRQDRFKKAIALLGRRGFAYSTAKKAFEDFVKK